MLGRIGTLAVAASLFLSSTAMVAADANKGALPQGTPAGVQKAQAEVPGGVLLYVIGGGVVVGGIILVATGNGHGNVNCKLSGCVPPVTTTPVTTTTAR